MADGGLFRNRWWMVFASVIGLTVNTGVISVFLFGVFVKPVTDDLGISRGTLARGLIVSSIFTAIGTPLFGKAIDHFGIRRVHLPMIAAYALATAALSLLQPSLAVIFLLFTLHNICGTGQSPVAYSKTWPDGSTRIGAWRSASPSPASGLASSSCRNMRAT